MAVWHFKVKVLPEEAVIAVHGNIPHQIDVVRFDPAIPLDELEKQSDLLPKYWLGKPAESAVEGAFSVLLPENESWSEQAKMFGDKDADSIQIWKAGSGEISRLVVCFSLSKPNVDFMKAVLATADSCKCVLHLVESMEVIAPELGVFVQAVEKSSAFRFVPADTSLESNKNKNKNKGSATVLDWVNRFRKIIFEK